MLKYQAEALRDLFTAVAMENTSREIWDWLSEKVAPASNSRQFNIAFVSAPRKTGKAVVRVTQEQEASIREAGAGLNITIWTADRLCRVWLLFSLDHTDREKYFQSIENLFLAAEVNELVALYSALPVLHYPEMWVKRCAEGIRSSIGAALEAVACNNPYPAAFLDEAAWNQLVLKVIFTDKPLDEVIGLDERSNADLAKTLSDYAHERWAAHRSLNPLIWRCVGKFIDAGIFPDIERLAASQEDYNREAAALACLDSGYPPAQELLNKNPNIKSAIVSGQLSWKALAEKMKNHVLQS